MVHTPISGYRELNADELKLVNQMKEIEERVLRVLDTLVDVDPRWLAIGKTHIEQGFGAVNRSITKPGRVALPEDERPLQAGDVFAVEAPSNMESP
jgi:hypothetical protein